MAKKSFNQKFHDSQNMPMISELTAPQAIKQYSGTKLLIALPLAYDEIMKSPNWQGNHH